MGKIQHLRTGVDGEIQSADILLPNHMMITRAINFLYPLELPTLQEENKNLTMVSLMLSPILLMIILLIMIRERHIL